MTKEEFKKSITTDYSETRNSYYLKYPTVEVDSNNKKRLLFTSLRTLHQLLAKKCNALQVSNGIHHYRRDAFGIDVDNKDGIFKTLEERKEDFKNKITDIYGIEYSGYSYKKASGSIHWIIYLTNYYTLEPHKTTREHEEYKVTSRKLASLINGDNKYKFFHIRNPYFNSEEYISEVNEYDISKEDIQNKLKNVPEVKVISGCSSKGDNRDPKKQGKQILEIRYTFECLKNNPEILLKDLIQKVLAKRGEFARLTNSEMHSIEEVTNRVKYIFSRFKQRHLTPEKLSIFFRLEERKNILFKNIELTRTYRSQGLTQKEIAEILNLKIRQIKNYCAEVKKTPNNPILTIDEICWKFEIIKDNFEDIEFNYEEEQNV
jgi:hypothetical protein